MTPGWDNANGVTGWTRNCNIKVTAHCSKPAKMSSALMTPLRSGNEYSTAHCPVSALSWSLLDASEEVVHVAVVDAPSHGYWTHCISLPPNVLRSPAGRPTNGRSRQSHTTDIARSCSGKHQPKAELLTRTLQSALEQPRLIFISNQRTMPTASACVSRRIASFTGCFTGCRSRINRQLKVLGNLDIAEHRLPQDGQSLSNWQETPSHFVLRPYHVGW